jgi:hypothetical protein
MKSIPEALNLRYSILQNIEEALLKTSKGRARRPAYLCAGRRRAQPVLSFQDH